MARRLFLALLLAAGAQMLRLAAVLPDPVASHFGGSGAADGWMSRDAFVGVYAAVVAASLGPLAAVAFGLGRAPVAWINVPHREHYLAPERREATLAALSEYIAALGALALTFLIAVMEMVRVANLATPPRLPDTFIPALALFAVATVVILIRRFPRPAQTTSSSTRPKGGLGEGPGTNHRTG